MSRRRLTALLLVLLLVAPAAGQEWQVHTVRRGENLTVIARRYGVAVEDLREWNALRSDELAIGQRLRIPAEDQEWYEVRRGDTLLEIAIEHDIALGLLRRLNDLRSDRIFVGQRLRLRPAPTDEPVVVVRRGDTLTSLARRHGTSVRELQRINGLDDDRIYVGQQLRLVEADRTVHVVEKGDALSEIAAAYGLTVQQLREINNLPSNVIHPGQVLKLKTDGKPRLATYSVRPGDNLTAIARLHQMSLRELQRLNELRGSLIHPGQELRVRPRLGTAPANGDMVPRSGGLDWRRLAVRVPGVRRHDGANGPYYWEAPSAPAQPGRNYAEKARISPRVAYHHGRRLWEHFERTVDSQAPLSNALAGWHFVLDPGHGGIDPGAIVKGRDEGGRPYYVVEDEYAYDIALRTAALLKLHGARVTMTVLASNHLVRGNEPVTSTFVNDRHEVFNDEGWNRSALPRTWPKGGQRYLNARIHIARRALAGVPADRQVFLSFHADNVPEAGDAVTLFYYKDRRRTDTVSREFARRLLPEMGAGARIKGQSLGVLRDNPVRYRLLVEMRNLAYPEHIWALRYSELRQRDAEKVVRALVAALSDGTG